jgi:hypothetical protein
VILEVVGQAFKSWKAWNRTKVSAALIEQESKGQGKSCHLCVGDPARNRLGNRPVGHIARHIEEDVGLELSAESREAHANLFG